MKSETKDNVMMIWFAVLIVFNMFAIATNLASCICTVGDTVCAEVCEQRDTTNHTISFVANIMSFIGLGILAWVWSDKK